MSRRTRALALAGTVLLASCDLAPTYETPAKNLPIVPASYREAGPWQPATPADRLPRGPWWTLYHDATLNTLETRLIAANPDLAAAVATYNSFQDNALELNANLFPFVLAGASSTRNHESAERPLRTAPQPTNYNAHTLQAGLRYEVDLWDQLHNEVTSGVALAQASAADLANAQLSLEASLANAYLTLRELDNDIKLLTDTVAAYQRYLQIVRQRHEGEIASGLEVSQAAYQLEAAQAQESGLRAQRAVYEHMIAALVGQSASAFSIPVQPTKLTVPVIPTGVPSDLLQRRPDIAAAERRVASENALIGVARAAFYPTLDINLLGGFQSSESPALLSVPFRFWTIGPSAAMPLFEGGLLRAQLAQTVAQWQQAGENYRAIVLAAFQDVEDALSNVNYLTQQDQQQQAAVRDAVRTQDLAFDLYQGGAVNYLEVIVDQTAALEAQVSEIGLQEATLQASVALIRALGGGWSTDRLPDRGDVLTLTAMDPHTKLPPAPAP